MRTPLRAATRGSRLALRQVAIVSELLGVPVEPVVISTLGDRRSDVPLRAIAGQGAFAGDVRTALARGLADVAVHSAKDLPPQPDPRFELFFPPRADPRDVLVGARLDDLAVGATVATGAPRRRAQLARLRPDLRFAELRGNIDTRVAKADQFGAVVVAAAALHRLAIVPELPTQILTVDELVPQVGQGALAVEVRAGDHMPKALLEGIEDRSTRMAVTAERAFLAVLGGDCDLPAGAHATVTATGHVEITAVIADSTGRLLRVRTHSADPETAGAHAASALLGQLGSSTGAAVGT